MDYTPTRQRPARELLAMNIALPYFAHDLDAPVTYHLTVVVLDNWELEALTIAARKHAAALIPNVSDNRANLDYPARPKEVVAFIRHMLLNRTENNKSQSAGFQNGYDNILHKIQKKGVDVEARQLAFKRHVGALIAASYPHLADEVEYWLWQVETNQQRKKVA